MDINDATLTCAVNLEWTNAQGTTNKKVAYKKGDLRLIRNSLKEILVEVSAEKASSIKLRVKNIIVHKKFMIDGKASLKFQDERCTMYLSNAPASLLVNFLKILYIKMTTGDSTNGTKEDMMKKTRAHILAGKANHFEEISPVTNSEMVRAKNLAMSKATATTPSPISKKRRLSNDSERPAPKKLYAPSPLSIEPEIKLNEGQQKVLNASICGKNVFFTGSAGTGKSFLLRKILATLPPDGTTATASTGVAACLIGGTTLHSFAGIGSGEASLERCYEMASRPASATIWRKCKRLIIDEISMVDGDYFEKIEAVARYVRKSVKPFGGIQLILCGDFFQLPPVVKVDKSMKSLSQSSAGMAKFCFQTKAWRECLQVSYELTQVHRQKDQKFIDILNSIRIGRITPEITISLQNTSKQQIESNGILATQLCSHTNDADLINRMKLENLKTEEKVFMAQDSDEYMTKTLDQQVQAPLKLTLKIGAQVMLLKNLNISEGLVNGARGVVLKYTNGAPVVKFKKQELLVRSEKWSIKTPGGMIVTRTQLPLKLAWAFSIHKSQGLTLDCVEMSLAKVFEAGQAYVALSRAQSLDSLRILDFNAKQVWANPRVLEYYRDLRRQIYNTNLMMPMPVGRKTKENGLKKSLSSMGLTKSALSKPLVTIN